MTRIVGVVRPGLGALALLCGASAVLPLPASAQPVVQPLPDPAVLRRNEALRALAQDPRSIHALVDAGQASLALDDIDSALGFFNRAEAVDPADGRVKAGLASVMVRQGQPLEALRLFSEAERAGEAMLLHAADRGLAYDLIGDNARAQEQYAASLSFAPDPAVVRRMALSQAISGNPQGSEVTLLPLLQRSDLAAYRTRAFALAIVGRSDEAVSIAETLLPERLSSRMAPYLRYMPRLTRAQQAAAANLGVFPPAAQIGRDDPALAAYAGQIGVPQAAPQVAARSADARLVPSGEPLGRSEDRRIPRREDVAAQQASPPPQPVIAQASPPPVVAAQAPAPQPQAAPPRVVQALPQPVPAQAEPALSPQLAQVTVSQSLPPPGEIGPGPVPSGWSSSEAENEVPEPSISIAAQEPPPPPQDFGQVFSDFSLPNTRSAPAEGAVDITQITPKREPPKPPPAPPKPPPVPSRQWVQVATGRDTGALAFDWRRIRREAGGLLDRSNPHVAAWGQTNRLVVGPFASVKEANDMVAKLKEKNVDSFRFTSAQGEDVKRLN